VKRRLFNVLAGVSLLLGMAAAAQWARSMWYDDTLFIFDHHYAGVGTCQGLFWMEFDYSHRHADNSSLFVDWDDRLEPDVAPSIIDVLGDVHRILGFGFRHSATSSWTGYEYWTAAVPLWFVTICCGILPARWAILRLKRKQRDSEAVECGSCGYDLRATPDLCPECGSMPKKVNG
jgi:hypothetical protein